MSIVKIQVANVGQAFAVCADVVEKNGRRLYSTPDYPYGHRAAAYEDARQWAEDHHHTIADEDEDAE